MTDAPIKAKPPRYACRGGTCGPQGCPGGVVSFVLALGFILLLLWVKH